MKKTFYYLSFLILFLFNINFVYAAEYNFTNLSVQGYNNNGNSLNTPSVFNCNEIGSCGMDITTIANSYGGAWGIQSPIPLVNGHQYAITLRIRTSNGTITLSSKPNIALGSSMSSAKTNYQNSSYNSVNSYYKSIGNQTLQYIIQSQNTSNYLIIPFTTTSNVTATFIIDSIIIDDLGATPLSETQINNYLNNQTSVLQADINNLQEEFNTSINDAFNNCVPKFNLLDQSTIVAGDIAGFQNSIRLSSRQKLWLEAGTYTLSSNAPSPFRYVAIINDVSPPPTNGYIDYILDTGWSSTTEPLTFNINKSGWFTLMISKEDNARLTLSEISDYYFQLQKGSSATSYQPFELVCTSKIDETNDKLDDLNDTQQETNNKLDDLNDNITDSDTSDATNDASDFFSNFNTDTFGLTSVITAPLELIKSVTSKTCNPLHLTLPFVNKDLNLPCLSTIYEGYFGSFLSIYRTITFGFVSYWVCIKIFNLVKDFKNPEHDEIEVLDL